METIKKLIMVILCMILALSCKSPLEEGVGGGDSDGGDGSGGGTQVIDGKTFPAWYLTEQQQQQDFSMGPTILLQSTKTPKMQHYRIPAIIVASNGNIIAIADNRYTHGGDIGAVAGLMDVVYRVSKDGGKTWSAEKVMGSRSTSHDYSKAENKGDAIVFRANDGTLVCMAGSGGGFANATASTPSRMVRSESTDNGETWSAWQEVGQDLINSINDKWGAPKAFIPSGRGLTLKDGTFAAAMIGATSSGGLYGLYVYSRDKGKTWHRADNLIASTGGNGSWNEPKVIAELDDGKLLMSVRNNVRNPTKSRMYAVSTSVPVNGNCTWPNALSAWDFRCGNADAEGVVWTRKGEQDITRIVHIQAGPDYRKGLRLYVSINQGLTFPKYLLISPDTGDEYGAAYCSLDVCGDGTIVTLAEERSKTGVYYDIVFRRYNMKTITGEVYQTSWYK